MHPKMLSLWEALLDEQRQLIEAYLTAISSRWPDEQLEDLRSLVREVSEKVEAARQLMPTEPDPEPPHAG